MLAHRSIYVQPNSHTAENSIGVLVWLPNASIADINFLVPPIFIALLSRLRQGWEGVSEAPFSHLWGACQQIPNLECNPSCAWLHAGEEGYCLLHTCNAPGGVCDVLCKLETAQIIRSINTGAMQRPVQMLSVEHAIGLSVLYLPNGWCTAAVFLGSTRIQQAWLAMYYSMTTRRSSAVAKWLDNSHHKGIYKYWFNPIFTWKQK